MILLSVIKQQDKIFADFIMKKNISEILLLFILVVAGILCFYLRTPYFKDPLLIVDEALYSEVAMQFMDGEFKYKNNKPPAIFFIYAGVYYFLGKGNIHAVEKIAALTVILSGFLLCFIISQFAGKKAGGIAGITYMILPSLSNSPSNFYAANTEIFLVLSEFLAIIFFFGGLKKNIYLFAAGAFCGLNLFIKQPGVLIFPMLIALLIIDKIRLGRNQACSELAIRIMNLSGGFIAVVFGFFMFFKSNGALNDLIYNIFTVNKMYFEKKNVFLQGIQLGFETTMNRYVRNNYLIYIPAMIQFFIFIFSVIRNFRKNNSELVAGIFFVLWLPVCLYRLSLGWRFSGHYYYMLFPVVAGLFGIFWHKTAEIIKKICGFAVKTYYLDRAILGAIMILSLLYPLTFYTGFPPGSKRYITYLLTKNTIGENIITAAYYITAHTKKTDTVFVWGYCPEIYHISRRRCASVFAHCDYLVGEVDPYPAGGRMDRVDPMHWQILFQDLSKNRPEYIIDISPSNYLGFGSNTFDKYPLSLLINENYEFDKRIGKFDLYRIKKTDVSSI